jgi:hypothetical protein
VPGSGEIVTAGGAAAAADTAPSIPATKTTRMRTTTRIDLGMGFSAYISVLGDARPPPMSLTST